MADQWGNVRFDFADAAVLVTGGTGGIGAMIASAFRDAGARVTVTGTRSSASDYEDDLSCYRYVQLDLEDADAIRTVTAQHESLDILVNNGGLALSSLGLDEGDPEVYARAVNLHLTSTYRMAHGCLKALRRSTAPGGAAIVNIGSGTSFYGVGQVPGYGSAKTGLLGLTRALAVRWGGDKIRVNTVAPGLTESRMTAATMRNVAYRAAKIARTPSGRLGVPADIAGAVLFLASDAASWINGQALAVDGGYTIQG